MNPRPEPAGLRFRHSGLAAALLLGIAVLVGGLGWWNTRRGEAELSALRGKLCGELPQAFQAALLDLARETSAASDTDQRALMLLQSLVELGGEPTHDVRILQKMPEGWREWRRWREHADWAVGPPLLDLLAKSDCGSSLKDGKARVARRLRLNDGTEFVLVTERHRS